MPHCRGKRGKSQYLNFCIITAKALMIAGGKKTVFHLLQCKRISFKILLCFIWIMQLQRRFDPVH